MLKHGWNRVKFWWTTRSGCDARGGGGLCICERFQRENNINVEDRDPRWLDVLLRLLLLRYPGRKGPFILVPDQCLLSSYPADWKMTFTFPRLKKNKFTSLSSQVLPKKITPKYLFFLLRIDKYAFGKYFENGAIQHSISYIFCKFTAFKDVTQGSNFPKAIKTVFQFLEMAETITVQQINHTPMNK